MSEPPDRLEEALAKIGSEHEPPQGWQERVLSATRLPRPRRWWIVALPMIAAAAAVTGLWVSLGAGGDDGPPGALSLDLTFDKPGTVVRRVSSPHAGDVAHITSTGGIGDRVIWVYRENQLVVACPGRIGEGWCRAERDASIVDVQLGSGNYEIVVLSADVPLLPPSNYDNIKWDAMHDVPRATHSLKVR